MFVYECISGISNTQPEVGIFFVKKIRMQKTLNHFAKCILSMRVYSIVIEQIFQCSRAMGILSTTFCIKYQTSFELFCFQFIHCHDINKTSTFEKIYMYECVAFHEHLTIMRLCISQKATSNTCQNLDAFSILMRQSPYLPTYELMT